MPSYPRVLQAPPLRAIFLLEDFELLQKTPLPVEGPLPFAEFIDDQLRVHFEINNFIQRFPRPGLKDFLDPDGFYDRIAPSLIDGSLLKNEKRLLGGITGVYYPDGHYTDIAIVGILPREETQDIPASTRKNVFLKLCERMDEFNLWLGSKELRSGYTVIDPKKMAKVGWKQVGLRSLKEWIRFYTSCFPICLRRRQKYYVKKLAES